MKALLPLALAAALGAFAVSNAHAEGNDSWVVRVGGAVVAPKGNNGNLAGARADVTSNARPTIDLEYMITPNWGVDVLGASPFLHDISLAGLGTVARTKELPPTFGINYHFMPDAAWSPFLGAGVNYTNFFGTHGTGALYGNSVSIANSWGPAVRVGFDMKISEKWLVTADVRWAYIESDVKVDNTKVGTAKIDPIVFGASVGYRF